MHKEQPANIIKETFDCVSSVYDSEPLRFFSTSAEYLASLFSLHGNERVLDVATGTGNAALAMAKRLSQGYVTGIDFSSGMLDQARKKAAARDIRNVEFLEMDMQRLDFHPQHFDAASCAFGIFFVDDMDSQLAQIIKTVKPGGQVAICNFQETYFSPLKELLFNRLFKQYTIQLPPPTWKRIAHATGCRDLFEKEGLRDIKVEEKNMGYFLTSVTDWWEVVWNAGFHRLVSQLPPAALEQFKAEHLEEVATLMTKDGLWLDVGILYTIGKK